MSPSDTADEDRFVELYKTYIGEPDRRTDIYVGFALFFGGLGVGLVGLFLFAIERAALEGEVFWVREIAFSIGAVGLLYAVVVVWYFARRVSDDVTAPNVDRSAADATSSRSLVDRVRAELRSLVSSPGVLALALLSLFSSTANWGFTSYAVVFLTDGYGVALDTANLTLTAVFVVSAGAILLGGDLADRVAPGPVLIGSFAALVVLLAVVAAEVVSPLAAIALMLGVGAARSLPGPARSKLTDSFSPDDGVGKSFAVITVGIMLGSAVAPPVFGYLIEARGLSTTFFAVAGVALLATLVTVGIVFGFADGQREPAAVEN